MDAEAEIARLCEENARLRRELEERRWADERYQALVQNSTEGIWRFALDAPMPLDLPEDAQVDYLYRHLYLAECNEVTARQYGFSRAEDALGLRTVDHFVPGSPDNLAFWRAQVCSGFRMVNSLSQEKDIHGRVKYFLNNFVGIIEGGFLLGMWGTQRDITELTLAARRDGPPLSPRELEVLRLMAAGRSNGEIGAVLFITEGTVKGHVNRILAKLGVADRTQALLAALRRGLVALD
jgi:DNA-binding CsgD family transcriptional regulator